MRPGSTRKKELEKASTHIWAFHKAWLYKEKRVGKSLNSWLAFWVRVVH
jgi:hypothetical protein